MSSRYIHIHCYSCGKSDCIYTGDADTPNFDCEDWEDETIEILCKECKEVNT